jgi:hypothetical protein
VPTMGAMHNPTALDRPTLYRLAAEADTDPRTILAALAAARGERRAVAGRAGERAQEVLQRHGFLGAPERAAEGR